jgi:hypothetical protein
MSQLDGPVRYMRAGGRPPPDDERLVIAVDGTFEARRTVAGHRVGDFRGRLDATDLNGLAVDADAAAAADDLTIGRPFDAAVETTEVGGRTATMGSNEGPTGAWAPLVERLRRLIDRAFDAEAVNGIELVATARAARLRHIGDGPIDLDRASVMIRAVRIGDDGAVIARWQAAVVPPAVEGTIDAQGGPDWVTATPDWSLELPFAHGIELASGDWLQVWVFATVRADDGPRAVRLYSAVQDAPAG